MMTPVGMQWFCWAFRMVTMTLFDCRIATRFKSCWVLLLFFVLQAHANKDSSYLLLANRKDVRLIDISKPKVNVTVIAKDLDDATSVDYFYDKKLVCWADATAEVIKCVNMTGNTIRSKGEVVTAGMVTPDGIAADWIGNMIYWTDREAHRIEVSTYKGEHRRVLIWEDLDQPRAIVVVPSIRWMFWSDWGEVPKIEKASMDGDVNTRTLLVNETIFWPNGLTVDVQAQSLYWCDAKLSYIAAVDLDGKNKRYIAKGKLPHPYSITVVGSNIYWTDWTTASVHTCNKFTGKDSRVAISGHNISPMGVIAYGSKFQANVSSPCQYKNGGCSHLCLLSVHEPYYKCSCPTGIRLVNKHTCASDPQDFILLARRADLRRFSLDTPDYTDVVFQLSAVRHAIAIDYDPVEQFVYWSDDEIRAIQRVRLNSTDQQNLIYSEVDHPDGIAVDWVARNLYWTDTGTDRIEVSRLDGRYRKILITDELDQPRAIVVDPSKGYFYWTDWGQPAKIERAEMDGSARTVIIDTDIVWPNGLALDMAEQKLYWCDAQLDKIEMSNTDGSDRRVLIGDRLPHTFGLTLLGDYIYWTDWQRRRVERADKITGDHRVVLVDHLPDLMGLKAASITLPDVVNPCAFKNGGCSHLCLFKPKGYICACPMGYELTSDLHNCTVPEAFLLLACKDNVQRISLSLNNISNSIIPISGLKEIISVDLDIADNRIYWSDVGSKSISRAYLNGSEAEKIIDHGIDYPECVAVDWIAHNMYWADTQNKIIEVARTDGCFRKVIVWKNIGMLLSIAVDPSEGYIYWSQMGIDTHIERANMDGTGRHVIITDVIRASSLTIDFNTRYLYWVDLDGREIERSDLSGKNRQKVVIDLAEPMGLTQYQDFIYWTDWYTHSLLRANNDGSNETVVQGYLNNMVSVMVFHTSRQVGWNPCAVHNGGCSHLCMPRKSGNQDSIQSFTSYCICATHYTVGANNKSCKEPQSYLLFSQKNIVNRLVPDTDDYPVSILAIVGLKSMRTFEYDPLNRMVFWIDSRTQSIKRSFTNGTHLSPLLPAAGENFHPYDLAIHIFSKLIFWSCMRNNVINVTRMDGQSVGAIVTKKTDRPRSIAVHLKKDLLFWVNMVTIPRIEYCLFDGLERHIVIDTNLDQPSAIVVDSDSDHIYWTDMGTGLLETATIEGKNRRTLVESLIQKPIAIAIYNDYIYWMDKEQQAIERVDKNGGRREVVRNHLNHVSALRSVSEIPKEQFLEHPCYKGNGGCSHLCARGANGSAYCGCPQGYTLIDGNHQCGIIPDCAPNFFACRSTPLKCIPVTWRCDGRTECDDHSDEEDCPVCQPSQFKCSSGDCISVTEMCDGFPNCPDGSDEVYCCPHGQFRCSLPQTCIYQEKVCDGVEDCVDGSDESENTCPLLKSLPPEARKSTSIIAIVITVVFVLGLGVVFYYCRRKVRGADDMEDAANDPLTPKGGPHQLCPGKFGKGFGSSASKGINPGVDSVRMSMLENSSGQYPPGRGSSSSSGVHYPHEPLNPPPSPATETRSHCTSSSYSQTRHPRRCYQPPPPTPCSTDVCDDSDSYVCSRSMRYFSRFGLGECDSEPYPPPPTPRSNNLSDASYPPSPSTERSYYRSVPPPPAPSPIAHSDS